MRLKYSSLISNYEVLLPELGKQMQMDGWKDGWMGRRLDGWMEGLEGRMGRWQDELREGWMDW